MCSLSNPKLKVGLGWAQIIPVIDFPYQILKALDNKGNFNLIILRSNLVVHKL